MRLSSLKVRTITEFLITIPNEVVEAQVLPRYIVWAKRRKDTLAEGQLDHGTVAIADDLSTPTNNESAIRCIRRLQSICSDPSFEGMEVN